MCKLCPTLQGYCEGQLKKWAQKSVHALQRVSENVSSRDPSSTSRWLPYSLTLSEPLEATDCSVLTVKHAIIVLLVNLVIFVLLLHIDLVSMVIFPCVCLS